MTDNEIHDLIDRKNADLCSRIDGTVKTLTEFIATENQELRKSIDKLTDKVEKQNGSVRDLKEWRAKTEGKDEGVKEFKHERLTMWQLIGVIFGIIVSLTVVYGFVKSISNQAEIEELRNKMYWKQDRMPDSTVRSFKDYDITQDTVFIRRLEQSTKELMK